MKGTAINFFAPYEVVVLSVSRKLPEVKDKCSENPEHPSGLSMLHYFSFPHISVLCRSCPHQCEELEASVPLANKTLGYLPG